MTCSIKIQNNSNEDKVGPRIRHPSTPVYLDIIYMKEKRDNTKLSSAARLYQTILEYSLSSKKLATDKFRITQICHWILKHNSDYLNHYAKGSSASHITQSNKIRGIAKRIRRYLSNLQRWGLIEQIGETNALTNNGLTTKLYQFTDMGFAMAWLLEYQNSYEAWIKYGELKSLELAKIAKREIFDHIKLVLEGFQSYMTDFLARFYTKCIETDLKQNTPFITKNSKGEKLVGWGIFDSLIIILINILNSARYHYPKAVEYLSAAQTMILTDPKTANVVVALFLKALDELPEETRKIVIANEKAGIESSFVTSQPSKDWQSVWFRHLNNYDILVLYGVCKNKECKRRFRPVLIPYRLYRERQIAATTIKFNDGFEPASYFIGNCEFCNTKDSISVFDSYSNVRRCLNKILLDEYSN